MQARQLHPIHMQLSELHHHKLIVKQLLPSLSHRKAWTGCLPT